MANRKVKRYDGDDESLVSDAQSYLSDTTSKVNTGEGKQADITPAKPSIVTKEQLAASGYDNLRDYLNAQRGLTRRDGSAPSKTSAPKAEPKAEPKTEPKTESKATSAPASSSSDREGGIGPYKMFSKAKTTEEGLARMRAKDEAIRNAPGPLDNLRALGQTLRRKAGITSYAKGGSASSRGDGIAQRGKTKCRTI